MNVRPALAGLALVLAAACSRGPAAPAALDTKNESCSWCRMAVSDARFAAQLVAPSEEPLFFDDIGCLATFLKSGGAPAKGQIAYVADHGTKAWVRAAAAVYTKKPGLQTPMGSGFVAHVDAASRDADPDAAGGAPIAVRHVFGPNGVPDGGR
ncbi:MAG TPA: nitrous oxide reductase accessory protein NosL [Thermoanaerobaculia bacterium]|nr:nitrous oxide reductase accessory protein NosL [Thermoanaerobaculia bacterium]